MTMNEDDRKPTASLGKAMVSGLSELVDVIASGEPIASRFRVRTVRYDRDEGRYEVTEHGTGGHAGDRSKPHGS